MFEYVRRDAEDRFVQERRLDGGSADAPQANERNSADYEYFLGVRLDELKDQRVLNIGTGKSGIFEREAVKKGAEVIALSPNFAYSGFTGHEMRKAYELPVHRKVLRLLGMKTKSPCLVAGVAEDLPLDDGSIDMVVALYSVPLYSTDTVKTFQEISRVLADGGKAVLYPISETKKESIEKILSQLPVEDVLFESIAESDDSVYRGETAFRVSFKKTVAAIHSS